MNRSVLRAGVSSLVIGLFLLGSIGEAFAVLIHESREDYYSTGGTLVTGCSGVGCLGGAATFSFGDTSGTVQWEVVEKVFSNINLAGLDAPGHTVFRYTVFNNTIGSNIDPITSFHVTNSGFDTLFTEVIMTAPLSWAFFANGDVPAHSGFWSWTTVPASGIPPASTGSCVPPILLECSQGGFDVEVLIPVTVGFRPTFIDQTVGGDIKSSTNQWMVSAPVTLVSEPTSLFLLGAGLVGLAAWSRKRKRPPQPA